MQAWLDKRKIAVVSLLVAGLSAPAGSAMSLPEPLGSARAELAEVTVDQLRSHGTVHSGASGSAPSSRRRGLALQSTATPSRASSARSEIGMG